MPDAAITTDIIVGFPGETEEDFAETLRVVEAVAVRLARSRSSTRRAPGTAAADLPDQVPKAVVQERYERLIALQDRDLAGGEPARRSAARVEVLVAEGEGRKDGATHRRHRPRRRQPARAPRRCPPRPPAARAAPG